MSDRKHLTRGQRLDVHAAASGRCHICGGIINLAREDFEVEHPIPLAIGGADHVSNMRPAHIECHRQKTKGDRATMAKVNRVKAKHEGTYPPSRHQLPTNRSQRFKKLLNGAVVDRETGEIIGGRRP